jgi:hypothetical protein
MSEPVVIKKKDLFNVVPAIILHSVFCVLLHQIMWVKHTGSTSRTAL